MTADVAKVPDAASAPDAAAAAPDVVDASKRPDVVDATVGADVVDVVIGMDIADVPSGIDVIDVPPVPDMPPTVDAPDAPPMADVPDAPAPCATMGETRCAGACVNTLTNAANCGGCGNACPPGLVCRQGMCECPTTGETRCPSGACVNLQSDLANCGSCGNVCASGQTCTAGRCVCIATGLTACGNACVNTNTDRANCGMCGRACTSGRVCVNGVCDPCAPHESDCNNACVDLGGDANNCGMCGRACPSGTVCVAGDCGAARLDAMYPSIIDRGDNNRVCFHGAFGANPAVTFPGVATSVTATRVGGSLVCVDVPPEATAGNVTVRSANGTTGALPFRRTSFLMGLQPFRARYEQTSYARQTPSLLEARAYAGSFEAGIHLYVVGGRGSGGALRSIERAMINADGTLGAFERSSRELVTPREGPAVVRLGGFVYVIGGRRGGAPLETIERAAIGSDGAVGPFATHSIALRTARSGHAVAVVGGYVYVFGGRAASDTINTVERAPILPSGELGDFALFGRNLPSARADAAVAVLGQSVCLFGGTGSPRAVDCAPVMNTGALDAFVTRGTLAVAREGATATQLGGRVYVFGGRGTSPDSVDAADVSVTGTLSGFATTRNLLSPRRGAVLVRAGNYVYLIGGEGNDLLSTIERAQFVASGTGIQTAVATTATLPAPRLNAQLVAIGPYVYVFSGSSTPSGTGPNAQPILRGLVQPDGRVDAFETLAINTRRASAVVVIGSTLFNVGAADYCSYGPGGLERYAINPDGSLAATTSGAIASPAASFFRYAVTDQIVRVGGYVGAPCGGGSTQLQAVSAPLSAPDTTTNIAGIPEMPSINYATPGIVVLDDVLHVFPSDSRLLYRTTLGGAVSWTGSDAVLDVNRWGNFEVVGDRLYALGGGSSSQRLSSCAYATIPLPSGTAAMGAFTSQANCQAVITQTPSILLNDHVLRAGGYDLDANSVVTTTWRMPLR